MTWRMACASVSAGFDDASTRLVRSLRRRVTHQPPACPGFVAPPRSYDDTGHRDAIVLSEVNAPFSPGARVSRRADTLKRRIMPRPLTVAAAQPGPIGRQESRRTVVDRLI